MTTDSDRTGAKATPPPSPAEEARLLIRQGLKCALGTIARASGNPYVSLVTIATNMSGAPIMLISKLALHTHNLLANPHASLLFDGSARTGDPLAGGRVSLMGQATQTDSLDDRQRFLARHRASQMYADFPDFAFYTLTIESAHFIGGFGRIVDLKSADLLLDLRGTEPLLAAEPEIVSHMNADHAGAVALYATHLAGRPPGPWRMSGLDPEGFDLVCDGEVARILFGTEVLSANAARLEFVRLAADARAKSITI